MADLDGQMVVAALTTDGFQQVESTQMEARSRGTLARDRGGSMMQAAGEMDVMRWGQGRDASRMRFPVPCRAVRARAACLGYIHTSFHVR